MSKTIFGQVEAYVRTPQMCRSITLCERICHEFEGKRNPITKTRARTSNLAYKAVKLYIDTPRKWIYIMTFGNAYVLVKIYIEVFTYHFLKHYTKYSI